MCFSAVYDSMLYNMNSRSTLQSFCYFAHKMQGDVLYSKSVLLVVVYNIVNQKRHWTVFNMKPL